MNTDTAKGIFVYAQQQVERERLILNVRMVSNWSEAQVLMAAETYALDLQRLYEEVTAGRITHWSKQNNFTP